MGRNKEAFGLDSVVGRGTCLPTIMVTGRVGRTWNTRWKRWYPLAEQMIRSAEVREG